MQLINIKMIMVLLKIKFYSNFYNDVKNSKFLKWKNACN